MPQGPARPDLVLTGALQHSRARNFNDFTANGLPYGADYDQLDLTGGLTWSPKENESLKAGYGFYFYEPNSNWNIGDYEAHEVWLEASKKF